MGKTSSGEQGSRFFGVPRLPAGLLSRPRLLRRLDERADLTVVHGPAGIGKTALVADWVRRGGAGVPVLWVTAQGEHVAPRAFWRQVLQAVVDAGWTASDPGLGESPTLLRTTGDPRGLVIRVLRRIDREWLLVVDDAFRLAGDASHPDNVEVLMAAETMRVAVLPRRADNPELTDALLRLDATVVGPDELQFTDGEVAALMDPGLAGLPGDDAERVRRSVGRLPLMVRAAAVALDHRARAVAGGAGPARDALDVDDIVRAALTRSVRGLLAPRSGGEGYRPFLLATSIAPVVTPELAARLTGVPDARAVLDRAAHEGLGLWTPAGADLPHEEAFRYSPAVRAVLREELARVLPERVDELKRVVARWAEERGMFFTAFRCAMEVGDHELASHLARRAWEDILLDNTWETVTLLEALSLRTLYAQPLLAMLLALHYNASRAHRLRAVELFGIAVTAARLRAERADPADRMVLLSMEGIALRLLGRLERAVPPTVKAMEVLGGLTVAQRDGLGSLLPTLLNQNGATFFRAGRYRQALETYAVSHARNGGALRPEAEFTGLASSAGTQAVMGDLYAAAGLVARIDRTPWPQDWTGEGVGAQYRIATMLLALERLDFGAAQKHIDAMARHLETLEYWATFAYGQALIDLAEHRPLEGVERLTACLKAGARPGITEFDRANLEATQAVLLLSAGRTGQAESVLRGIKRGHPWAYAVRAIAQLVAGRAERVVPMLEVAPRRTREGALWADTDRWRSSTGLFRAAAALREGHEDDAAGFLETGAAMLRETGRRLPLLFVPRRDLEALAALAESRSLSAAGEVLAEVALVPSVLPETLRATTLTERERVVLLQLVTLGGAAEIARALTVSPNTVKSQLRSLYRKLGVRSRDDALRVAAERGLLG